MEPQHSVLPDWAYPAEDDMPESLPHLLLRTLLFQLVRQHLAAHGTQALTGSDQFIYWIEGNPQRAIAPDVYVLLGQDPTLPVRVVKTWELGAPDLVIEVVSEDVSKDYEIGPKRYGEMGVAELIVIDPTVGPGRHRFQSFQREEGSGDLVRVAATSADRIHSPILDCHLRWMEETSDGIPRVRLATGPHGDVLVPTHAESEHAERAAKESERTAKEAERAAKESERAQRIALEARVAELEARLAETDDG